MYPTYVCSMLCLCGSDVNNGTGAGVVRLVGGHWRLWEGYPPGRIPQCVGLAASGSVHSSSVVTTAQVWLRQCVHACLCALVSVHMFVTTSVYACVNVHVSERFCSLRNSLKLKCSFHSEFSTVATTDCATNTSQTLKKSPGQMFLEKMTTLRGPCSYGDAAVVPAANAPILLPPAG